MEAPSSAPTELASSSLWAVCIDSVWRAISASLRATGGLTAAMQTILPIEWSQTTRWNGAMVAARVAGTAMDEGGQWRQGGRVPRRGDLTFDMAT